MFDFTPDEITAILLSLKVSLWAMVVSLPLGVLVALALARGRFWGKSLLNGVVHLPLVWTTPSWGRNVKRLLPRLMSLSSRYSPVGNCRPRPRIGSASLA